MLGKPLEGIDDEDGRQALDPLENVRRRNVAGGPAPEDVAVRLKELHGQLEAERRELDGHGQWLRAASARLADAVWVGVAIQ